MISGMSCDVSACSRLSISSSCCASLSWVQQETNAALNRSLKQAGEGRCLKQAGEEGPGNRRERKVPETGRKGRSLKQAGEEGPGNRQEGKVPETGRRGRSRKQAGEGGPGIRREEGP